MSDLEREMSMLQGMDLSGTVPATNTQVVEQPQVSNEQLQAQAQVVQQTVTSTVPPVQPVQPQVAPVQTSTPQVLNLDNAQESIDNNAFVTVDMGQKVSNAIMDKFKGQKDEKKRISILMPWFDDPNKAGSAMVIKRHYDDELGSFICFGGECCQYSGNAAVRYLFPVIEYPIANNDATRPLPEAYGEAKLKLLVAGNELYSSIADVYSAHGNSFDGYDLIMTCTEQQYQSFTVTPTNDTVRNNYKSYQACLDKWKVLRDKAYTVVAKSMDREYYRTQKGLGYTGATVPTDVPSMDAIIQQ